MNILILYVTFFHENIPTLAHCIEVFIVSVFFLKIYFPMKKNFAFRFLNALWMSVNRNKFRKKCNSNKDNNIIKVSCICYVYVVSFIFLRKTKIFYTIIVIFKIQCRYTLSLLLYWFECGYQLHYFTQKV